MHRSIYDSPIGELTLVSDDEGQNLIGLWAETQLELASDLVEEADDAEAPVFPQVKEWLNRYFAGKNPHISELPLKPMGSEFRQLVWEILQEIPYGGVMTYGEIATQVARRQSKKKMSSRAVGGAVGHNPISIIIPCHRVVGAHGNLTGYGGGLPMKIRLLELEKVNMADFYSPTKGTKL